MNSMKTAAILLIAAGILVLAYGGFSYTREKSVAKIGNLEMSMDEKETVNLPVWLGVGAIVIGGVLLVVRGKKA